MKSIVVASLLAACSSHSPPPPELKGSAPAPGDALVEARSTRKVPVKVERQMPDAAWEHAADVVSAWLVPFAESHPKFTRVELKPIVGSDGSRLEFLMRWEAFSETESELRDHILVAGGKLADPNGPEPATEFLHAGGFPGKRIDRGLLLEVLEIYGVVTGGWIPSHDRGWAGLDESRGISKPVVLDYDKAGATLTLYRGAPNPDLRPGQPQLRDRLIIHFDAAAKMTMANAREQVDGTWKPIAPEH